MPTLKPRGHQPMAGLLAAVLLVVFGFIATGCEKDPHDPNTWIPKLDNLKDLDEAVQNLDRLKDLRAIKPLGEAWKKHGHPSKLLRTMINIAQFDDPTGEKAYIKRSPDYTDAVPYLIEALEGFAPDDPKSIDDGTLAAETLGKSKSPDAVAVLVATAKKTMPKSSPALRVKSAAVRALGGFKDPRAIATLIEVLSADPATQDIRLAAVAALALAETGDPKALPALAKAAFVGPIFNQVRAGFTRGGKDAVKMALEIFEGKQADVLALAKEKKWPEQYTPGAMGYIGAILLGDLRDKAALPELIAALQKPPIQISAEQQITNHHGIIQALRLIGGTEAADALYTYMTDPKIDKALFLSDAINAYGMISADTKALPFLEKLITDESPENAPARVAAAIAYSRLGRTAEDKANFEKIIAAQEKRGKELDAEIKAGKGDEGKLDQAKLDNEKLLPTLKESVARLEIGVKCGVDAKCYAEALSAPDIAVGKPGLPRAERALLEIAKLGDKASGVLDILLDPKNAGSSERFVREPLLMALPRIAPLPCDKCAAKLDAVLDAQAQQTTLDDLNRETRLIYHYFLWAGK